MNTGKSNQTKLGVIFLGRRRPGFDMDWGKRMEDRVRGWFNQSGVSFFEAPEKVVDDTSLRNAMISFNNQKVDAIVLLQSTMGDARLAPTLAQLWPDPIILWATPENQEGDMISSCSLVGLHCWASILRQMDHGFEIVNGDPDAPATRQRFTEALHMVATIRKLRTVRLGVVGGQAPGYFVMGTDLFSVYRGTGAQVQMFSLLEFANVANDITPKAVSDDVAKFKSLGIPHRDTTDADLPMASRLYLTMRSFLDNENLDALTIREWPEMPNTFGQWPYLGVARLVEEGRAIGIEGDADGALCAWIGESLGLGRCYLSDWLEHDDQTITLWHGGAAPMSLCPPVGQPGGPCIAKHFNIKKPAVLESTLLEKMPVTVFRFWRLDGKYYATAREGQTIKPRRHLMMTNSLVQMNINPAEWFEELCHQGMPHHVSVVRGHHAALLKRMARVMNIQFV
jgi:L-arabinose isomerase